MKLVITIDLSNAAFQPDPVPEVVDILRALTNGFMELDIPDYSQLVDSNGNTVGSCRLEE